MVKNLLAVWETQPPTPVFLPGESHGQRSLAGYSLWDWKESDTAEPVLLLKTKEIPADANDVDEL